MRAGWSYVGRRALFALITIFVAVSLNFVLFRLAPGDRTSALRCQGCTEEFKQQLKDLLHGLYKWQILQIQ